MSDVIIGCIVSGGLGNQIFMVSATIAHGARHSRTPRFYLQSPNGGRPAYWDKLFCNVADCVVSTLPAPTVRHAEPSFSYTEIPANADHIYGYFQSEKYFKDQFDIVYRRFGIPRLQQEIVAKLGDPWICGTRVSLHIRLGDYVQSTETHPVLPPDYYHRALAELSSRVSGNFTIYCFYERSDRNMAMARIDPLREAYPTYNFVLVPDIWQLDDWEELLLMSCCDHHIIANSSFSWWGAYFNTTQTKVVCRPSVLTGPALPLDISDYYPPEWICVAAF